MPIYATESDLADWTEADPPSNAHALLRSASAMVADATKTAIYDVNPAGLPLDVDIVAAMRDATCAQAAMWAALGNAPALGGLDTKAQTRSKRIGSAGIDSDTSVSSSVTAFAARREIVASMCAEAMQILSAANLLNGQVWSYG